MSYRIHCNSEAALINQEGRQSKKSGENASRKDRESSYPQFDNETLFPTQPRDSADILPDFPLASTCAAPPCVSSLWRRIRWSCMEVRSCLARIAWILGQSALPVMDLGPLCQRVQPGMWSGNTNTLRCMSGIERLEEEWPWVSRLDVHLFLTGFHLGAGTNESYALDRLLYTRQSAYGNSSTPPAVIP